MSKRNPLAGQLLLALFMLVFALAPGQVGAETPSRVCLNGQCYTVKTTGRMCVNGVCATARVVNPAKPIQTPLPPAEPVARPASSAAQPAQSVTANKPVDRVPPAEPVKPTRTPLPRLEPPPTPTKVAPGQPSLSQNSNWCPPGPGTENVRCLDRAQAQADRATTTK